MTKPMDLLGFNGHMYPAPSATSFDYIVQLQLKHAASILSNTGNTRDDFHEELSFPVGSGKRIEDGLGQWFSLGFFTFNCLDLLARELYAD